MISDAIEKHGNKITLSLSPGGGYRYSWGDWVANNTRTKMYRITTDFWGGPRQMRTELDQAGVFAPLIEARRYQGYASFPDLDMIPIGQLNCQHYSPPKYPDCEESQLNKDPNRLEYMFSIYMISRAPLIMGGMLPAHPDTINFLTNKQGLEINGFSTNNHEYYKQGNVTKWMADLSGNRKAVGVFNKADDSVGDPNVTVSVKFEDIGLSQSSAMNVRDVWNQRDLGRKSGGFDVLLHELHGKLFVL